MPGKAETDGRDFSENVWKVHRKSIGYFENPLLENRQASAGEPGSNVWLSVRALELSADETQYLIQGYYDRCDRVFETEEPDAVYLERIRLLGQLKQEYLDKVHPVIRLRFIRREQSWNRACAICIIRMPAGISASGSRRKLRSDVTSPALIIFRNSGGR